MPTAKILACLPLASIAFSVAIAQENSVKPAPAASAVDASAVPCSAKAKILADGTLVLPNRDCSISRVPKQQVLAEPAEQPPQKAARKAQTAPSAPAHEAKPEPLPSEESDPQLQAKYRAATSAYYDYFTNGYVHRQRVFDWQLISSKIIFLLVTLLVASGVYFAALQFHEGMRRRATELASRIRSTATGEPALIATEEAAVTTFSASSTGVSVSSPVLGVIILVISLAFFYLYLVYVYPITELF